jgi:hypothetical protein
MSMIRTLIIVLLIVCWCSATQTGLTQPKDPDAAQLLSVAANGYRANLQSFEYVTCRYTITQGFAKSLDDALSGRTKPGLRTANAVFYKDGRNIRFRLEEDAATTAILDKPTKPEDITETIPGLKSGQIVPFMTTDYLLNENLGLLFVPRGITANIYDAGSDKGKKVDEDFLFTQLKANTPYDYSLLVDRVAREEIKADVGEPMTNGEFRTVFHLAKDPTVFFTVDLKRGSLPTHIELVYETSLGKNVSDIVVPQIRSCSKGRWFPERIVTFMKQFPTQSPCFFKEFKVVELDVDHRPSKDAFTLDLPAGTSILQFDDIGKSFKTRKRERIGPDDLGRIQELTEKVPEVPQTDTAIVPPPRSWTWVWYALVGGATAVLGLFAVRRRHAAKREQHVPS